MLSVRRPSQSSSDVKLISYGELAGLRLRDFLSTDAELDVEESGMIGVIGLGGFERFGETFFEWKQGETYRTAGITLDFGPDSILPEETARQIIDRLGVSARKGMTASELIETFGTPETDNQGRLGTRLLRFACGTEEQYLLGCVVDESEGLIQFFLARKDYCDADESL
jgi:hypothetical protein